MRHRQACGFQGNGLRPKNAPAPRKILSSRLDSLIPSLRSRNSRIGQGGKTAFIFPMLLELFFSHSVANLPATLVATAFKVRGRPYPTPLASSALHGQLVHQAL